MVSYVEQAIAALAAERAQVADRMATLDRTLATLRGLAGDAAQHKTNGFAKETLLRAISRPEPSRDDAPRGQQAIATVLRMAGGQWLHVTDLMRATQSRGWGPDSTDPVTASRTSADRLVARQGAEFERDNGRYRWKGGAEPMFEDDEIIEFEEDEEGAMSPP